MSERPRTRQELYDRIRETSKDDVILEDMIRLGFWREATMPVDPPNEQRRRAELERQIAALRTEQSRLAQAEAIRAAMRKQRLEASRQKRAETKARHERERVARAAAWAARRENEILHLGEGVSAGLTRGAPPDAAKLAKGGLPLLSTASDVAKAMGIDVATLRFLAYAREVSRQTHYVRFQVPKKTGGTRLISAPMPRLKKAQLWILDTIASRVALEESAHGFCVDRSIVTNALPHVGASVVVNLDLKDFFPTLTFRRIKGTFEALGYGEEVATLFALLTSEPEIDEVELDGVRYFVARGTRRLPQGSPASPAITNVVCRRLDRRLAGLARKAGFVYTRYADDLTFSSKTKPEDGAVGKLLRRVRWIVRQEGFAPHEEKTRILRRGRRQEVTGVVVNEKAAIPRDQLRRFRALMFQVDRDGVAGKRWGSRKDADVLTSMVGFASYVAMVMPERGKPLLDEARRIARKHGWKPKISVPPVSMKKSSRPPPPRMSSRPPAGASQPPPRDSAPPAEVKPPSIAPAANTPEDEPPKKKKKWWQIF